MDLKHEFAHPLMRVAHWALPQWQAGINTFGLIPFYLWGEQSCYRLLLATDESSWYKQVRKPHLSQAQARDVLEQMVPGLADEWKLAGVPGAARMQGLALAILALVRTCREWRKHHAQYFPGGSRVPHAVLIVLVTPDGAVHPQPLVVGRGSHDPIPVADLEALCAPIIAKLRTAGSGNDASRKT